MDKRSRRGRRGARGGVGGGFGVIDSFGGPRAAGVLTLLLLSFFTGAVALGAQSIAAAVLAFLFLAGAIAVVTAARARHHFAAEPAETGDPLEKVAEFHIDDLKTEDEPSEAEVNSLADLERSFEHEGAGDEPAKPSAPIPMPSRPAEVTAPAKSVITVPVPEAPGGEGVTVVAETPRPRADPDESDPLATAEAAHETISAEAAERPAEPEAETGAVDSKDDKESGRDDDEDEADGDDEDEKSAAAEVPAPREPDDDDDEVEAELVDEVDEDIDALMAPLLAPEDFAEAEPETTKPAAESAPAPAPSETTDTPGTTTDATDTPGAATDATDTPGAATDATDAPGAATDATETPGAATDATDTPGTSLSLLAAETPGAAPQYPGVSTIPPEAVRDVAATLIVADLSRSIMFYTELLGLVEIDRAPDAVLLEAGFGRVLLWRRDDAPGAGDPVMHLTFEVGDIDAAYDSMRAKGIEFTHPPRAALSGEVHNLRAASFLDPDGHGLAITELREHPARNSNRGTGKTELAAVFRNSAAIRSVRIHCRQSSAVCALRRLLSSSSSPAVCASPF